MRKQRFFEVAIIGGGISGTSLLYTLAKYSNIKSVLLLEKYGDIATLNSNGLGNSQTLHCGDIETNYTLDKAAKVKETASMVENYAKMYGYEEKSIFKCTKMALGVGDEEVAYIKKRYEEFKGLYPYMEFWDKDMLGEIEPKLAYERKGNIAAMGVKGRNSAVNYGEISKSFVKNAKATNKDISVNLNEEVYHIEKKGKKFVIKTLKDTYFADYVVVNAGAHSLFLAHQMNYGLDYSVLPIGGSFYYAKEQVLSSKVYTVQNPKLPFAAIHGDPDIVMSEKVRFGPTALVLPKLERYRGGNLIEFLKSLSPNKDVFKVLYALMRDKEIRNYILKNFLYEMPGIRKSLFAKEVRKIIPSLEANDLVYADGVGGLRPQVIDKKNRQLLLGEAQIDTKKGIVFNMTPSPGATSCLGNAKKDAMIACAFLNKKFNEKRFTNELIAETKTNKKTVQIKEKEEVC